MKICMIGTGYVGLVSGTCFADLGNKVYCVDKDKSKINKLKNAISPIYEPGLEDLIRNNLRAKRLFFYWWSKKSNTRLANNFYLCWYTNKKRFKFSWSFTSI